MINYTTLAEQYRHENNRQDGIVIFNNGKASGWSSEFRTPVGWVAGCVAVDSKGSKWVAIGGDYQSGAECWELMQ